MTYALLLLTTVLWGGSFVATKIALNWEGIPPFVLLAARYTTASVLLAAIVLKTGFERLGRRDLKRILPVAVIYPGLYMIFETTGIKMTSASVAAVIIGGVPAISALLARFTLGERLEARAWAGVALAIAGVAALSLLGGGSDGSAGSPAAGAALMAVAALLGACYTVLARHLMKSYAPLTLTTVQNLFGAVCFAPLAAYEIAMRGAPGVSARGVAMVLFLGLFASVVAFLCYNKALKKIEAGRASAFINLVPVMAIICGAIFLKERLSPWQAAGGAAVIAGAVLVTKAQR